jgi:hypothetical protein
VSIATGFDALNHWNDTPICVSRLDADRRDQLLRTRDALSEALAEPGYTLTDVGASFAASSLVPPWVADVPQGLPNRAAKVVETAEFATLLENGLIVPPEAVEATAQEFLALREDLEQSTACVVEG